MAEKRGWAFSDVWSRVGGWEGSSVSGGPGRAISSCESTRLLADLCRHLNVVVNVTEDTCAPLVLERPKST